MRPYLSLLFFLLLLLLPIIAQGIRLEEESLSALQISKSEVELGTGMAEEGRDTGVAIHFSDAGRSRKLMTQSKNGRNKMMKKTEGGSTSTAGQKGRHITGTTTTSQPEAEQKIPSGRETPVKQPLDLSDLAGMDYSPANRKSPIHN